ncbi:MAG TPA: FkbM family methyltransferase [Candidatus Dormibacteraeota bacterium]|nr:FkbM family methyltransferase [Candidatus Dormibacteraeota bacterium]
MRDRNDRLARFFLRYASPFADLRNLPIVGPCLRWASAKIVPRDSTTWVQVQHGHAAGLWLRLNARTGRSTYEGRSEPEVQRALQEHLRPGMNFYDIGANIGFFSLLAARLVGKYGRVTAFEADLEIAERLREHVARNGFSWIAVEEKAVWSSEHRTVSFARSDPAVSPDRGLGHVVPAAGAGTIDVEAISLDDYYFSSSFRAPDFLKCDVEGAEVEVFRGARRLLKEKRPGILCEMHSEENRRILVDEFSRLGYVSKPCDEHHVLAVPE